MSVKKCANPACNITFQVGFGVKGAKRYCGTFCRNFVKRPEKRDYMKQYRQQRRTIRVKACVVCGETITRPGQRLLCGAELCKREWDRLTFARWFARNEARQRDYQREYQKRYRAAQKARKLPRHKETVFVPQTVMALPPEKAARAINQIIREMGR